MKKLFKWLAYATGLMVLLVVGILAAAYWNRTKLLNKVTAELNKNINGKFNVTAIDFTFLHHFPDFSITLHRVYLRDNHHYRHQKDFLNAEKIVLDVELYPLMKKEIVIRSMSVEDADVFIFKARNGDSNADVFKESDTSKHVGPQNSSFPDLQKINFHNVSVVYNDSLKNKFIAFQFLNTVQSVAQTDSGYALNIRGKIHCDSLHFNERSKSFLKNKDATIHFQLHSNPHTKLLTIQPSSLAYKQNEIQITGKFKLQKEGKFNLLFTSNHINPSDAKQLLNKKLTQSLSKFKIEKPIYVEVKLEGKSMPGYVPFVDVRFETKDVTLGYGTLDFSSLTAKGMFTNHIDSLKPRDNNNSKVTILSFEGSMEKIPVKGKVQFTTLQDPGIDLWFTSALSYKDVNKHVDNNRFSLTKGNFATEVFYKGKLSEYLDPTRTHYEGKLNGKIQATDASLYYKPKKITVEKIFLKCSFNENAFTIHDLTLQANGSKASMHGEMQNFIPFFIQPKNKGYVKLTVNSPDFDLTSLTTKRDVGKNKTTNKGKAARKKMTDLLDRVYDKLEFDVDVNIDHLSFRKFSANNFRGRVKLENSLLQAKPVSMQLADGSMKLNFLLRNLFDPISPMSIEATLVHADIQKLFENFNNFNQRTIEAKNLEGEISADVKFSASVNDNYMLLPETMRGVLNCKITDGGLKNFEPMENMSNFLFKKRDFSDVQFAELHSEFSIAGTNMDISRMEIQSTVLSLFLEGRYSFTDSTSLSVQIPLSNLKKRHKDFKPKNIGVHAKAGPSVYLHVYRDRDVNSKIKIDYDPFKKWASVK